MAKFAYEAQMQSGELVADQIEAASVSAAIGELETRGLTVRSIRIVSTAPVATEQAEAPVFYRRIEAALAQREALIAALEAFAADMTTKGGAQDLRQLIGELRRGATANDFIRHESAAVWLPLILRSPASSLGNDGFRQLLAEATREADNRALRRRMLLYPVTMLAVAALLALVLLYAIVPSFGQMYREFDLSLGPATGSIIWLSDRLRESGFLFLLSVALMALAVYALVRMWVGNAWTSRLFGSWIAGNSLSVAAMARFTGTLGELLALDAPLPEAIRIAGRASQHPYYRDMAEKLAKDTRHGETHWSESAVAEAFPANVIYALNANQDGGPNIPLLRELSSLYSDRMSERFDWSAGIIAPLTIAVVGILVGFFVLALLVPLMSLISGLS